jgi:hypothetical protein
MRIAPVVFLPRWPTSVLATDLSTANLGQIAEARDDEPFFDCSLGYATLSGGAIEGNGKVGWKILEFGGSHESAVTQTLKLTLTPLWKRPDGTLVRDFTIASVIAEGDRVGPHS